MPEKIERRGRPRKWTGKLADWMVASGFRVERLADELEVDISTVYCWLRGAQLPSVSKAQAITEIARRSGRTLSLEDILNPRRRSTDDEEKLHGVLSRPTSQARDRRLATATK